MCGFHSTRQGNSLTWYACVSRSNGRCCWWVTVQISSLLTQVGEVYQEHLVEVLFQMQERTTAISAKYWNGLRYWMRVVLRQLKREYRFQSYNATCTTKLISVTGIAASVPV